MTVAKPIRHGVRNTYIRHKCRCDECVEANAVYMRAWADRHRDRLNSEARARRALDPQKHRDARNRANAERREEVRAYWRRYRDEHRSELQRYMAAYGAANRDRIREVEQRRINANFLQYRLQKNAATNRRRRRLVTFVVTATDWRRICEAHGNCCAYCGRSLPLTVDHLIPVSRGGVHSVGNIIPACRSCNSSKRQMTFMEFRLYRMRTNPRSAPDTPLGDP